MTITAAELKRRVEHAGVESHFFTRRTMKFFGDTMRNYGARGPLQIQTYNGPATVFELYRRRPVKHGLIDSAFFDAVTFERRFQGK